MAVLIMLCGHAPVSLSHTPNAGAAGVASLFRRAHGGGARGALDTLELVANGLSAEGDAILRQLVEDAHTCGVDLVYAKRAGGEGEEGGPGPEGSK